MQISTLIILRTAISIIIRNRPARMARTLLGGTISLACCSLLQVQAANVTLAWDPSVGSHIAGYRLYSGTTSGVYTQIIEIGNTTSTSVSNLTPGQKYFFAVTAYNTSALESVKSNEVSYTAPTPPPTPTPTPPAPSSLTASPMSSSQINLAWKDNSNNETGFKIQRSTDGITFTRIAAVGANTKSYVDTGLNPQTKYWYRVRAYNQRGNSGFSNTAIATTPPRPPSAPTALTATAISQTRINLAWRDNSRNETGFYILRSIDGTSFSRIAAVGANVTSYTNMALAAAKKYYYRVRAYNSGGSSLPSNTASATTLP